jgi:hypothetical protein
LKTKLLFSLLLPFYIISYNSTTGQTITGAWKGKIKNTKLELKLIRTGDSLTGTSYYYKSKENFRRYSVKGYFDPLTNQVIWWDDMLIADKAPGIFVRSQDAEAMLSTADFNCPGEDVMLLDGSSSLRDNKEAKKGIIHLEKIGPSVFKDEWDFVIENYTVGANDPYVIDSISNIAFFTLPTVNNETSTAVVAPPPTTRPVIVKQPSLAGKIPTPEPTIEDKFIARKKKLATVIPLIGDSIELRFYDNAEIDGDSIALFLNDTLVFKNIRLTDQAYTIKFAISSLQDDNELVMVAENLGSIPPNTSLMVVIVGDKRYEARLQSTENSSALIRFLKQGISP